MKTVEYHPKGTTVYYFDGFDLVLRETIVEHVNIGFGDNDEPIIVYTVDSGKKNMPGIKLPASRVYADREKLKEKVLNNFVDAEEEVIEAPKEA